MLQLLITVGIMLGYSICYASVSINSSFSSRLPFVIQGMVCSVMALDTPFIPFSPR
jgi:cytochrome c oxidase assembly factor CtaG